MGASGSTKIKKMLITVQYKKKNQFLDEKTLNLMRYHIHIDLDAPKVNFQLH